MVWWSSGSGYVELDIPRDLAGSVLHPGDVEDDVRFLMEVPEIKAQLEKLDPKLVSLTLKDFGCWNEIEREDHQMNLVRLLWIAASDVAEGLMDPELRDPDYIDN